jgi:hypothetical protein
MSQDDLSAAYHEPLAELQWVIENTYPDTFSLLFACCEDLTLRPRLVAQLVAENPNFRIRCITLAPDIWLAYHTLKQIVGRDRPDVLFIDGLEAVNDVRAVFRDWNKARDAFPLNFPFPMVIWLDRAVQKQLIHVAKDLETWGSYIDFENPER